MATVDISLLLHLNPTARAVVELLQDGASPPEIALAFADAQGLVADDVLRDVEALVDDITQKYQAAKAEAARSLPVNPDLPEPVTHATYRFFGKRFEIKYPDQRVAATCHPILAPMSTRADSPADVQIDFHEVSDGYRITGGQADITVPHLEHAAFTGLLRVLLWHDQRDPPPFNAVLHAGSVVGKNGAWLIGGHSGSGKSTLISRLDAQGYRMLGDDLIPIDLAAELAFPLPLAMSMKEPAWPVVAKYRPEIAEVSDFITGTGKRVRYLAPLNPPIDADRRGTPVAGLLLPRRTAGARPALRPISLKRAMVDLCDKFGRFPINPPDLASLIATMGRLPRFELVYDEVEDILPELGRLL